MLYLTRHIMHQFSRYTAIWYMIVLFTKVLLYMYMYICGEILPMDHMKHTFMCYHKHTHTTHMRRYATYMPLCGITCTACCILPCHVDSTIIFLTFL